MLDKKSRILVVDDALSTRKIVKNFLSELGYVNVDEATDGSAAWIKVQGSNPPYSLILADWHMPNMSGYELLLKVRENPTTKKTPVVLATAERKKEEIEKAIKGGVTNYLIKPFAIENIKKVLDLIPSVPVAAKPASATPTAKPAAPSENQSDLEMQQAFQEQELKKEQELEEQRRLEEQKREEKKKRAEAIAQRSKELADSEPEFEEEQE